MIDPDALLTEGAQWLNEHASQARPYSAKAAMLIRALLARLAQITEERDNIAEELASNRACNLFTWKQRAEQAEAEFTEAREDADGWKIEAKDLRARLEEAVEAEADLARVIQERDDWASLATECNEFELLYARTFDMLQDSQATLARLQEGGEQVIAEMHIYETSGCYGTNVKQWADRLSTLFR